MRVAMRAGVVPKLALSVAGMVGRVGNTFVMFFTESAPRSRVDLRFGLQGTFGRTFEVTAAVVVVGCKGN
jgi:hypothetical protein